MTRYTDPFMITTTVGDLTPGIAFLDLDDVLMIRLDADPEGYSGVSPDDTYGRCPAISQTGDLFWYLLDSPAYVTVVQPRANCS